MPEKTSCIYMGYDFRIDNNNLILDKELVLTVSPYASYLQIQLPWKEGDRFELVVENERTVFKRM